MAGLEGFAYYKEITISNTNVDADIANFPVYVSVVNDTDIGGHCIGTNGYDIQFANADNSETLTFERIYWNNPAGTANGDFYVLVNPVDHDANTVIRCYYGKSGETDHSSPENTFATTNGWVAVWHLEEASNPYLDATSNNHDSTAGVYPDRAAGKIGYGQDFDDADSELISIPDADDLDLALSDITITAWMYQSVTSNHNIIFGKRGLMYPGYRIYLNDSPAILRVDIGDSNGNIVLDSDSIVYADNWYHVGLSADRDSTTGLHPIFNGVREREGSNITGIGDISSSEAFKIGQDCYGIIDEVRVSNILRSDAWLKFEYYNSHDGHAVGNELSWGGETPISGPAEPIYLIWTK